MVPSRFGDRRRIRIGLLGGSFNPAHEGHGQMAERALRALRLDQVWLLVSPGNPLKAGKPMATINERLASAARFADGRRIVATDIERHLNTRFTHDTLAALRLRFPAAQFVWLMGADSLRDLPHWRGWDRIVRLVPFAVFPRPSYNRPALSGQAAHRFRRWRRRTRDASRLASAAAPAWVYLVGPETNISATALREAGQTSKSCGAGQGDRS